MLALNTADYWLGYRQLFFVSIDNHTFTANPRRGTPDPIVCPQCGTVKKTGQLSCCVNGGSWSNTCGEEGNTAFAHTWSEGIKACKGESLIRRVIIRIYVFFLKLYPCVCRVGNNDFWCASNNICCENNHSMANNDGYFEADDSCKHDDCRCQTHFVDHLSQVQRLSQFR